MYGAQDARLPLELSKGSRVALESPKGLAFSLGGSGGWMPGTRFKYVDNRFT
jgi:hypothetical protein